MPLGPGMAVAEDGTKVETETRSLVLYLHVFFILILIDSTLHI